MISDAQPERQQWMQAMSAACDFLVARQSPDGAWRDFQLARGASDAWVTAYVGLSLLAMGDSLGTTDQVVSLRKAGQWLVEHIGVDYGWGYNDCCPTDADSTACGILFLAGCSFEVPGETYQRLLSFQQSDGGFATYQPLWRGDSWGISHADVTAMAIRALLAGPDLPNWRAGARKFVSDSQEPEGVWRSFWWRSEYYSTLMNLRAAMGLGAWFGRDRLVQHLGKEKASGAFERALLVQCLLALDLFQDAVNQVTILMADQEEDGGWPAEPILRQPYRICKEPWRIENSGSEYADQHRLFTTATALEAIARFAAAAADVSLDATVDVVGGTSDAVGQNRPA